MTKQLLGIGRHKKVFSASKDKKENAMVSRPFPSILKLNSQDTRDRCWREEEARIETRDFNDPLRLHDVSPHPPFSFDAASKPVTQFAYNDVTRYSTRRTGCNSRENLSFTFL